MPQAMDEARRLLRHHFGHPDFRPAQVPVIRSVLAGRDTLAVLPTGGGKSVCFQVPALVSGGLTLVVSPLIALMQDQVAAARARGITAAALHSALDGAERRRIAAELRERSLRLLYVSPERLVSLVPELADQALRPSLLAIDEAHCIAEWGHDFRPSYRALGSARYRLGRPPAVALTGSATPEVRADIARILRFVPGRFSEHVGSFDRANLWFGVVRVASEQERLAALVRLLAADDRMVIVYAPTRSVVEAIARTLAQVGHRAAPYHAGLSRERRVQTLEAFLGDQLDVIVATCAFGMGIDKPQIRLVVHWTLPPTPEAYYQEAGRAGRDGEFSRCVLLWREGDAALHRRQLDVTFPARSLLERIWRGGQADPGVAANVRESAERLRRELRPERGEVDWSGVLERRRRAEARIVAVEAYARGRGCRRKALVGYFGERLERCSGCDRCRRRVVDAPLDPMVAARMVRLRAALSSRPGPWGAALIEPETMLTLARTPPSSAAALAAVPGIGCALAERWGRVILGALDAGPAAPSGEAAHPRRQALENWRARVARAAGVPAYVIIGDETIAALLHADPKDLRALADIPGMGPRALAKHGTELLALIAEAPSAGYLEPTNGGGAGMLEHTGSEADVNRCASGR
ncbi:MAG TPA: ATP-dependent DNA helicase RecQ [Gemmatimonadales bacterium]|nr:ATP-dependent DNA helicase RecQ [Gemmatimonadales bacterium]